MLCCCEMEKTILIEVEECVGIHNNFQDSSWERQDFYFLFWLLLRSSSDKINIKRNKKQSEFHFLAI